MQQWRLLILALGVFAFSSAAASANSFTTFTSQGLFLSQLGLLVTDTYDAEGYKHGDIFDAGPFALDIFSSAGMSGVLGETTYESTTFTNLNIIEHASSGSDSYCAGCNGSFRLTFASTSVGGPTGVYGVGFVFSGTDGGPLGPKYVAYVGFGDGTFENLTLPVSDPVAFLGLTSPTGIQSIHFGLADGLAATEGNFALDELTIGAAPGAVVPEPGSLGLLGLGLLALTRRRFVWRRV
jgi:hypothetical protein